jgi:hypothetical protein
MRGELAINIAKIRIYSYNQDRQGVCRFFVILITTQNRISYF